MRKRSFMDRRGMVAALLLAGALVGCGDDKKKEPTNPGGGDEHILVTREQAGTWSARTVAKVCGTQLVVQDFTQELAFCEGGDVLGVIDFPGLSCDVTRTGSGYHVACTAVFTEGECQQNWTIDLNLTVTDTTLEGVGTLNTNQTGSGCKPLPPCLAVTLSATRIGELPSGACGTP